MYTNLIYPKCSFRRYKFVSTYLIRTSQERRLTLNNVEATSLTAKQT